MKIFYRSILVLLLASPFFAFADNHNSTGGFNSGTGGFNVSTGGDDTVTLENPLGDTTSFRELITKVLDAAFVIGLPIAVLFIALAGLRFVLARGNQEQLTKAKTNLFYTVVGIAIFFGAWLLAKIIETTINSLRSGLS